MILLNPSDYVLLQFEISKKPNKKYDAVLINKHDPTNIKKISFGDTRYEQYFDQLGYYKSLNHDDKKRRLLYRKRHAKDIMNKYSSGWFAYYYLW
jgi:hypothetical protein